MTDKQIIRAEIDRLQSYSKTMGDNAINSSMQQFYDGMKESCIEILSFIDSMPEEPSLEVLLTEYEKGRYDMREEMMKDAIEADAIPYDNEFFCDFSQLPDIGDWERVKLIVVKED